MISEASKMAEAIENDKILYAEIDVRSYFIPQKKPLLVETIQAIDDTFPKDYGKVVRKLHSNLDGIFRIYATDFSNYYPNKMVKIRNVNVPVTVKMKREIQVRTGILVTIYRSYVTVQEQAIPAKDFDDAFTAGGNQVEKITTPQFYKETKVLNGNRYVILKNTEKLQDQITVNRRQYSIGFRGQAKYCYLCKEKHTTKCPQKVEFDELKEKREGKILTKVFSDSTMRHTREVALLTDVCVTSGAGLGQIANIIAVEPDIEKYENIVIVVSPNEARDEEGDKAFVYTLEKSIEKIKKLKAKTAVVAPIDHENRTPTEKLRNAFITAKLLKAKISTIQIKEKVSHDGIHPTEEGTEVILKELTHVESRLSNKITTNRIYSGVQCLYKYGCRACESTDYTPTICERCQEKAGKQCLKEFDKFSKNHHNNENPSIKANGKRGAKASDSDEEKDELDAKKEERKRRCRRIW